MDLKTLTEINAPSGHEQAIRRFLLDELKKLGFAPVLDRMGNVVVVKEGTGDAPRKRVMVSAHMDEVGLIVTSATEDGYLRIAAAGGIDPRVLVSKRVTVGDDKLPGVIGAVPIHLQSAAERKHVLSMDELLVDIGAKNKDEAECKAPMGTYISFDTPYVEYGDGFACGKAFDDRVGCLSLLREGGRVPAGTRHRHCAGRHDVQRPRRRTGDCARLRSRTGCRGVVHGWRVNCEPSVVPQGAGRGEAGEHSASGEAQRIRWQRRRRDSARAGGCAGGSAERAVPVYSLAVVGGEAVGCGEPVCAGEGAGESAVTQGFRLCGRDKGATKTDEVCDRPLDPFAVHHHVTGFLSE